MVAFSELILLAASAGALRSWSQDTVPDDFETTTESGIAQTQASESKSLYDLLEHFPTDKDVTCPGSDSRFRYPGECHRYVTCKNYDAHIHSCPPGMSFDVTLGQCRLSMEVDCAERSPPQSICEADEEYSPCKCERTCAGKDYDEDEDDTCEDCFEGCFCRAGYVRDEDGRCVKPEDCTTGNTLFFMFARF